MTITNNLPSDPDTNPALLPNFPGQGIDGVTRKYSAEQLSLLTGGGAGGGITVKPSASITIAGDGTLNANFGTATGTVADGGTLAALQSQVAAIPGAAAPATGLSATGVTPATATACPSASSNTFTTVAAGAYAILTATTINATPKVINRGANPLLLLPPIGWQFENFGVNQPIEVAPGAPGGGTVSILNEAEGLCRILSS